MCIRQLNLSQYHINCLCAMVRLLCIVKKKVSICRIPQLVYSPQNIN